MPVRFVMLAVLLPLVACDDRALFECTSAPLGNCKQVDTFCDSIECYFEIAGKSSSVTRRPPRPARCIGRHATPPSPGSRTIAWRVERRAGCSSTFCSSTSARRPTRWCDTMCAHGSVLSLRRGHDLGGDRAHGAHVLQLLDLPPARRAVVVLLAEARPRDRPDRDLSLGRRDARPPSLRDVRLHHALVAGRSRIRSHGRQRAADGTRGRRGRSGPAPRWSRHVAVPRLILPRGPPSRMIRRA
jgi:hypothetical protein